MRRFLWMYAVLVASVLALEIPAGAHDESRTEANVTRDEMIADVGLDQKLGAQLPLDIVFTDDRGQKAALGRYFDGAPVILALVYFDCGQVCPLILDGLARSLKAVPLAAARDYRVVAVSIDPRETPELARAKKAAATARLSPGAAGGWHFLTGDHAAIDRLAAAVGFRYAERPDAGTERFVHAAGIMIVTPAGKVARYFYGFDYPPRDVRLALVEASGNRIGSPVDQLLLLCYKYDPAQGKYTLAILNVLRFSAAATAAGLGTYLLVMFRRERAARSAREQEAR